MSDPLEPDTITPDGIRAGDAFVNRFSQLVWVAVTDAGHPEPGLVRVDVVTVTGEAFSRHYRTVQRHEFIVQRIGPTRILRLPARKGLT